MMLDALIDVAIGSFGLDLSLPVDAGQVVAVLGPNGAGKTTALRAIAGLTPIDRGRIAIDDRVLDDPDSDVFVPPEQREIGVMFQDYLLFPHLSALDNVAFGLRARRVSRRDARARAGEWLGRLGLDAHAAARPSQLSGGQAQRVALARALAIEPRVLLLDEPLAALDAGTREDVRRDLARHLDTFAGAVVVVSHDPVDAAVLADEIAILDRGRLVQRGPVDEVLAHPRSRYVADLVGVNLLEGRAAGRDITLASGGHVVVADPSQGDVLLVIEPRSIGLALRPSDGSARNQWPSRVDTIDVLGDRARVRLVGEVTLVAEVTATAVAELDLHKDREVWAVVKATEIEVAPR
jgi:molybdate transport system ATP-binding protein